MASNFVNQSNEIIDQTMFYVYDNLGAVSKALPASAVNTIVDLGKKTLDGLVGYCNDLHVKIGMKDANMDDIKMGLRKGFDAFTILTNAASYIGSAKRGCRLAILKNVIGISLVVLGTALSAAAFYYKNSSIQTPKESNQSVETRAEQLKGFMIAHASKVMGVGVACTALGTVCLMASTYQVARVSSKLEYTAEQCLDMVYYKNHFFNHASLSSSRPYTNWELINWVQGQAK